jgi:hypothetical protein
MQFFIKKTHIFFCSKIFPIFGHQNPGSGSGSALTKNAGSESVSGQCGSATRPSFMKSNKDKKIEIAYRGSRSSMASLSSSSFLFSRLSRSGSSCPAVDSAPGEGSGSSCSAEDSAPGEGSGSSTFTTRLSSLLEQVLRALKEIKTVFMHQKSNGVVDLRCFHRSRSSFLPPCGFMKALKIKSVLFEYTSKFRKFFAALFWRK